MRRKLFNVLSAVSLVLCVATVTLWVGSYFHGLPRYCRYWQLGSGEARISLSNGDGIAVTVGGIRPNPRNPEPEGWSARIPGVWLSYTSAFPDQRHLRLVIGHWLAAGATAMLFCWTLSARMRETRLRRLLNLCPTCGYDLRASPDRCPECGTPVPVRAK